MSSTWHTFGGSSHIFVLAGDGTKEGPPLQHHQSTINQHSTTNPTHTYLIPDNGGRPNNHSSSTRRQQVAHFFSQQGILINQDHHHNITMPPQHHHPSPGDSDLLSELLSHNAYFDSLVNMIPARLYIAGASGDDAYNPKYGKGQHKESKEARRARNKIAKREKFDPSKMETTLETKRRVQMMENAEDDDDSDEDGNDNMDMSDDDGEGDTTADANTRTVHPPASSGNKQHATNNSGTNTTLETQSYASRIEMLRAKLHAKMTEKRAIAAGMSVEEYDANNSKVVDGSSATSSTTTTPPALVSKRAARRAEKRKRQEAAKQRNKKNGYSTVIQGNGNNTTAQHQNQQHRMGGNNSHSSSFTKNNSPTTTIITASQDLATIDYQSLAGLKPKLDGALNNKSLIGVTGGGSGSSGLNKKKSLEKLLADAERKQARLRELKASGNEEDKEKARNIEWGETLKVAG
jgi:hypothetical protein